MSNRFLDLVYKFMNNEQGFKLSPTQRLGVMYALVARLVPEDLGDKEALLQLMRDLRIEETGRGTSAVTPLTVLAATTQIATTSHGACDRSSCGPCTGDGSCHCDDARLSTELRSPELRMIVTPMTDAYRNIGELARYFGVPTNELAIRN